MYIHKECSCEYVFINTNLQYVYIILMRMHSRIQRICFILYDISHSNL